MPATAEAVLTLHHNGLAVGTITFAAGSRAAAFTLAGGLALVPSDRLELEAPAAPPVVRRRAVAIVIG